MSRPPTPVLRVVLVNLAILIAGVIPLELAFGEWLRPNPLGRLNLVRDAHLTMNATGLYPAGRPIAYTRDAYGLRGSYPSLGAIDILTIGGSATDQRYIDDDETWQAQTRAAFARNGKTVVIVNAGVDGQSTAGHLRNYDWWFPNIPGLKSRYDLFYLGVNDFYTGREFDELIIGPTLVDWLKQSSALYGLGRKMRGLYLAVSVAGVMHTSVDFTAESWTTTPRIVDHAALAGARIAQYRQRLRLLLTRSAARGARPICVTQQPRYFRIDGPAIYGVERLLRFGPDQVNGVDYFHILNLFHRVTLETCTEFGGIALDAAGEVPWRDADFYDFVHNTPEGARKLAQYLHVRLSAQF